MLTILYKIKEFLEFSQSADTAESYIRLNNPKNVADVDRLTREFLEYRKNFVFKE